MSAPVSHNQLAMYMTAHELSQHTMGDNVFAGESKEDVMERKLGEAKRSGLASAIKFAGVQEPVHLYHEADNTATLTDGHHRLAVAQSMGKNTLLPVEHHDITTGL